MTIIRKPDPKRITVIEKRPLFKPERGNVCNGYMGVNKTGKSSEEREFAEAWRAARIPNLISPVQYQVVGYDPQNVFGPQVDESGKVIKPGLIDIYIELDDPDWALRLCELRNTLVILDEFKDLLEQTNYRAPKGLGRFFTQYWYNNVDILWSIHNPLKAPSAAVGYTTHWYIFLMFASEGSFKKTMPNYSLVKLASNQVNEYVRKHTRGKHKLDPEYNGQGFPHIIVNTEKQTLQAINMEKEVSSEIRDAIPLIQKQINGLQRTTK